MDKWTVETLNSVVDEELKNLSEKLKAKFIHIAEMIEALGLENIKEPYIKPLTIKARKKLWEIRIKHSNNIARAIYVTVKNKKVIILSAFVKKTNKIPKTEISKVLKRLDEVKDD